MPTNRLPIERIISKQVLPKLVTLLAIVSLIVFAVAFVSLENGIKDRHLTGLKSFKVSVEEKLNLLDAEVKNLSNNELITNALIDFEARQEYLPIFFRSLLLSGADNASIILTDFQGEVITSNNPDSFEQLDYPTFWHQSVLVDGQSVLEVNERGVLLINPVFYADLPEGALIVYIPSFKNIFRQDFSSTASTIVYKVSVPDGQPIYQTDNRAEMYATGTSNYNTTLESELFPLVYQSEQGFYQAYKQLLTIATLVLVTIAIVFFGSTYSNRLATQIASRSISQLKNSIESVKENDQTIAIKDADPSEVADLKATYNSLSAELFATSQSLSEFEGVIHSLNEFLVVLDDQHRHIVCNEAFKGFCKSIEVTRLATGTLDDRIMSVLPKELTNDTVSKHSDPAERIYRTKDQFDYRIVNWKRREFISPSSSTTGWVYVGTDITETKAIQADLEIKNKAIDEAKTSIVISRFMPGSPITYVNDAFTKMTGYSAEESIGHNCSFLQGPDTTPESITEISNAISEQRAATTTLLNYKKDGTPFYNELTISPIKNKMGEVTHVLGLQIDVSEAEKVKKHLSDAKQKAEESNELKSSFLASMSHEIRTPLNGVIGMLNILSDTSLDDTQRRNTEIAQSSANSLLMLINDILDISKIEAGKIDLEFRDFDILRLATDVAKPLANLAANKHNVLVVNLAGLKHRIIKSDETRVRQIILNLLSNALKFTQKGQITLTLSSEIIESGSHSHQILKGSVSDTGIGIPTNRLNSIFDTFTQADSSTTRKFGGTGLGLSICRQLAEAMGGSIHVESEINAGSTFHFSLETITTDANNSLRAYPSYNGRSALVAHPNIDVTSIIENYLAQCGLVVTVTPDATSALQCLSKKRFDLLVMTNAKSVASDPSIENESTLQTMLSKAHESRTNTVFVNRLGQESTLTAELMTQIDTVIDSPVTDEDLELALYKAFDPKAKQHRASTDSPSKSASNLVTLHKYPVLLVEDNPVNQLVAKTLLTKLDMEVEIADNGEIAIEMLRINQQRPKPKHYRAVFMDCQMPVMDGYEATRRIRLGDAGADFASIPIIAMTANAIKGDREKCIAVGMNDYISKPIGTEALAQMVSQWILKPPNKLAN